MSRIWVIAMLTLLIPATAFAVDEDALAAYGQANQAYFDGDYAAARDLYLATLDRLQYEPGAILLNLGNCAYRMDRLGEAVYFFSKARRTAGGEGVYERASNSLDRAHRALRDKYKKKIEKGIVRYDESHGVWFALFTLVPKGISLVAFMLFSSVFFASIFLWSFGQRPRLIGWARTVFLSVLAPTLVFAILYFSRVAVEQNFHLGVVVAKDADLKDAPDADAPGEPLPEGLEVRVLLHNESGFYKLELSDGTVGYATDSRVWALDQPTPH